MNATTVAVDLAKSVFQIAVADANWMPIESHRLTRTQFERWFANREVGLVIMFPSMVMHYKAEAVDPSTIEIKVPSLTPLAPGAGTTPTLGAPTLGAPTLGAPTLGAPALGTPNLGAPALGTPDLGAPETPAPGEGGAAAPALPKLGAPVVNP